MGRWVGVAAVAALLAGAAVPSAHAFDPAVEAKNFSKTHGAPGDLRYAGGTRRCCAQVSEAERDRGAAGAGRRPRARVRRRPVLEPQRRLRRRRPPLRLGGQGLRDRRSPCCSPRATAPRCRATCGPRRPGPAKRPGIVITNGSVQADEQMYWYAAQTLAKAGYVVLTLDPQGQGQSDTLGEAPDAERGRPGPDRRAPVLRRHRGRAELLPLHARSTRTCRGRAARRGTSHAAKQDRRVAGRAQRRLQPVLEAAGPEPLGLAGHSYGAAGVSYIGQWDPRVKAIVAWDNLGASRHPTAAARPASSRARPTRRSARAGADHQAGARHVRRLLPAADAEHVATPTRSPSRQQSLAYSRRASTPARSIIRGGSHLDFSFIPNHGVRRDAARRGPGRLVHDRLVRQVRQGRPERRRAAAHRPLAPRRRRGRRSTPTTTATCSPSTTLAPGLHRADGAKFTCEDIRAGCAGTLAGDDGYAGEYAYLPIATSPDSAGAGSSEPSALRPATKPKARCASRRRIAVHLPKVGKIRRVRATLGKHVVGRSGSRRIVIDLRGQPRRTARVRIRVTLRDGRRLTVTRVYRTCRSH